MVYQKLHLLFLLLIYYFSGFGRGTVYLLYVN